MSKRIITVKPGRTGGAQVNGYRGPTPTEAEIRNRVECDLWYIDNWSLRLDFWIIVRTVLAVITTPIRIKLLTYSIVRSGTLIIGRFR
jgi:lipopolysaccharide/colanic/teichoic acid biosynthesis glycosyltransferase